MDEILEINNKINYNDLTYHYITPGIRPTNLIAFRGLLHIFKEIKNGDETIKAVEEEQIKFKSKLGEITSGNPKHN